MNDISSICRYSSESPSAPHCAISCHALGYAFAGIQFGYECWCGLTKGRHGKAEREAECDKCAKGINAYGSMPNVEITSEVGSSSMSELRCGNRMRSSIYQWRAPETVNVMKLEPDANMAVAAARYGARYGVRFVIATRNDQSCNDVCQAPQSCHVTDKVLAGDNLLKGHRTPVSRDDIEHGDSIWGAQHQQQPLTCRDDAFALLLHRCDVLRAVTGCESCAAAPDVDHAFLGPYFAPKEKRCYTALPAHYNCYSVPSSIAAEATYLRVCPCG